MFIRHAKIEDLDKISDIEKISYPAAEGGSKESIRKRIEVFPNHFWLLENENKIVGFINGLVTNIPDLTDEMYDNTEMHNESGKWQMLFSVVTAPQHRGHGYAGMLMKQVIADARAQNRRGIVLTCKKPLIPFYAKFGFQNEGVSKSAHGGALWYQMRLVF